MKLAQEERAANLIQDANLIEWLKANYMKFSFWNINEKNVYIRTDRKKRLEETIGSLDPEKGLHLQREKLKDIWKDLVALAIVYLKSIDERESHHDDGDYGIDELNTFFDQYCDFEKILYGSSEYYRDHVSHVFKVFLLGEYLVRENLQKYVGEGDNKVNIAFSNIDVIDNKLKVKVDELESTISEKLKNEEKYEDSDIEYTDKYMITHDEKEAMWCIVSLTHDLGYPMETVHKIHEQIRKMLDTFDVDVSYLLSHQSHVFNESIIKLISSNLEDHHLNESEIGDEKKASKVSFTTHVQAKYYSKFSRELEKKDHGIESCIILMKTLVYFLETDLSIDQRKQMNILDARHFLIRQRILRAIASHNSEYIYHLQMDLSFLLRIIDEMQEWGRPKLTDLFFTSPKYSLIINWFKRDTIEYTIKFDSKPEELDEDIVHDYIKKYFKRKTDNYIKILRSAVDGDHRKLTLCFNVTDSIDKGNRCEYTYKFEHPNPKDIKISIILNKKGSHISTTPVSLKNNVSLNDFDEKTWADFVKLITSANE